MTVAYVAYPIDQADGAPPALESLVEDMAKIGICSYLPGRPWVGAIGPRFHQAISRVNAVAATEADVVVAVLTGSPTLGVPVEIERAIWASTPVAIWAPTHRSSVQLSEWAESGAMVCRSNHPSVFLEQLQEYLRDAEESSVQVEYPEAVSRGTEGNRDTKDSLSKIQVVIGDDGHIPSRSYVGDAGFDLTVARSFDRTIESGEFVDVPVDVSAEFPPDMWGWIVGRSSTLRNRGLLVNQGIIDQGYRGELYVGVMNASTGRVQVKGGERLAQLIPMPLVAGRVQMVQTDHLAESDRGDSGFGSTGL